MEPSKEISQVAFESPQTTVDTQTTSFSNVGLCNEAGIRDKGFTRRDLRDMQRLGKRQEMMRNFRPLSTTSFTVLLQATWQCLLIYSAPSLINGGLAGALWSYVFTFIGFAFVTLCLAEMGSMSPTSGGQYHWVSEFAPRKYQRFLSYTTGWMATLSWQAGSASGSFLTGTIIQALIQLNYPDYTPYPWQGTLLVIASIIICYAINIWGARVFPLLQNVLLIINIFAAIAVGLVIWIMCPRNTADIVFTQFYNAGQFSTMALAVMIGQSNVVYGLIGSDAVVHLAEEVKDAGTNVPKAMLWSYVISSTLGFIILVIFLFCLTNLDAALNDDSGFAFIWVFRQAVGNTGVNLLVSVILVLWCASTVGYNASTSRITFAFARDRGLPYADWIGTVHPRYHIPANAILATCLFSALLSLIYIGSPAACNAIVSLNVSALMFSYMTSISCVLWRRIYHPHTLPKARWSLDKYGVFVNVIALCYSLFVFFFSFWPSQVVQEAEDNNWSIVIFVFVFLGSMIAYWVRDGKLEYRGPVMNIEGRSRLSS